MFSIIVEAMVSEVLLGLGIGIAMTWLLVLGAVLVTSRRGAGASDLIGLLPRTVQVLGSLARDPALPRGVRVRLVGAILYSGQPFNLIPDWIPVVGYADNVAVICWALRGVVRRAGPQAVAAHWRGSPQALQQLYKGLHIDPAISVAAATDDLLIRAR